MLHYVFLFQRINNAVIIKQNHLFQLKEKLKLHLDINQIHYSSLKSASLLTARIFKSILCISQHPFSHSLSVAVSALMLNTMHCSRLLTQPAAGSGFLEVPEWSLFRSSIQKSGLKTIYQQHNGQGHVRYSPGNMGGWVGRVVCMGFQLLGFRADLFGYYEPSQ